MATHDERHAATLGDTAEIAMAVVDHLRGRSIGCAESLTAGRIASAIACVEGAAEFFRGSVVSYHESVKRKVLGVNAPTVFSLVAAEQMARGATRVLEADVAVATTGVAGGTPEDGVPVGTVFIATSVEGDVRSRPHHFDGDPEAVCAAATKQALTDLLEVLASRMEVAGADQR
ncbi:MAG TPA: CinA family protein [Ilumatobacteraceae bacterium]|jgi:nicotinamide-nucleotide amidase